MVESNTVFRLRPHWIERMMMNTRGSIVGGLALVAGSTYAAGPVSAAPADGIRLAAASPADEDARIDSLLKNGAEADPLELVPGATTDPDEIKQITESGAPATVVVDSDSGKIVAARLETTVLALQTAEIGSEQSA